MVVPDKELDALLALIKSRTPDDCIVFIALSTDNGQSMQIATNAHCLRCAAENVFMHGRKAPHRNHIGTDELENETIQ